MIIGLVDPKRRRPVDVVIDVRRGLVLRGALQARPKPSDFTVAAALIARAARYISTEELIEHTYGERLDGGPLDARGAVRQSVFRLNQQLEPLGIRIRAKRDFGYIADVDRAGA